ncbi:MAG: hypothetical protein WBE76_25570, partial [Terracidiphilus sp.]
TEHLAVSHARLEVRMESLLPFLQGTCTPYNTPVYPGAQRKIATATPHEAQHYNEIRVTPAEVDLSLATFRSFIP